MFYSNLYNSPEYRLNNIYWRWHSSIIRATAQSISTESTGPTNPTNPTLMISSAESIEALMIEKQARY